MLLFIILVLLLSIPTIQTKLGNYITNWVNEDYKTNINIGKVGLQFNGDVKLKEILIRDYKNDTLISALQLNTSIINFKNLYRGKFNFGDIELENLIFNVKKYKGETERNLDIFVDRFTEDNPKKTKNGFLLSSSDVSINNSTFRYVDENINTPKILEFTNLNINGTDFLIKGSDVNVRINTLSFIDSRGIAVRNISTNFGYTTSNMQFDDLIIKTKNSNLKGNLLFTYKREDFADFVNKVAVSAKFTNADISLNELNVFYNEFGKNQRIRFNTKLSGTLNNLNLINLKLNTIRSTKVYGNIRFKNLLNSSENKFAMHGNFNNLSSNYKDLKTLLPNVLGTRIPSLFNKFGNFKIKGTTDITAAKIDADIAIETSLGYVKSKLSMRNVNNFDKASYKGNVIFDAFNIGALLEDSSLGEISSNLDIDGFGFNKENLSANLNGDVYSIVYNNYNYKQIIVDGKYQQNVFNGKLKVNDKNLKLDFNGLADLSKKTNTFDFLADVDYANLNILNFYKKDKKSLFKGIVEMKMKGTTIDDAVGSISFKKTNYNNQIDDYYFEDFVVTSKFEGNQRFIDVNSPDIVKGTLSGEFKFENIADLFENSLKSTYTSKTNNSIAPGQYVDFNFKIYNKIVEVFYPDLKLGKNTFIKGRVETNEKAFKLTFKSPKIELLDYYVKDIELQVDNKNPLFNTYVEIDSINSKFYNVSKFNLINVTLNDTLYMRSEFKGGKLSKDNYDLSFYHTTNQEDKSVFGFKKSEVVFKDNKWLINEKGDQYNKIVFDNGFKDLDIEKIIMSHQNEQIDLAGSIRGDIYNNLKLNFKDVDLSKITPTIDSLSLKGNVNGKLDIIKKNQNYIPNAKITIDDLIVNRQKYGSFNANIEGNTNLTNYKILASIKDDALNSFQAKGDLKISKSNTYIDLDLLFNTFSLNVLAPFLEPVLSNVRGDISGKTKVSGNLKEPNIDGQIYIDNGGLKVPYLNVDFNFKNKSSVTLTKQQFRFNKINITDVKHNTKGVLNGVISHNNFAKWRLGLDLSTDRLLILDTKYTEEALYYGTGFISGNASISGPTEALRISATATTKKGTEFYIPLSDLESFGDNSFIHFLTPEEKLAKNEGRDIILNDISGLELDFDLDVTNDALIEIVMDRETGSTIRGRGVGGLLFNINTNDKFNMYGDFVVWEGYYNFLFGGVVEKKFQVTPFESVLRWDGSPLKAQIDIEAVYKTRTNPSPLLDSGISRTIPVELEINLKGNLEKPEPEFNFEFPNVSSTLKSEINYRLESKEDRDNQALYLLATGAFNRQFRDINLTGTLTERLNGLINGFFSDSDSKINIGLNYEAGEKRLDYETDDRLGVTLQTKITDRVLINGKVGVPVGGASESVIAGDVQIDFLLNEEGTLTATVFNRENSIRNFGEEIGYTQGLGIAYSIDFDTFRELLREIFNKKKKSNTKKEKLKQNDSEPTFSDPSIGLKKK